MLKELLQQLKLDLELDDSAIVTEKTGEFSYEITPGVKVTMRELSPGVVLRSQVGTCPKEKRETLFSLLMHANFLGQGTGKMDLGLDADEKFLTLSAPIPYEIDYRDFKEKLEAFANFSAYWTEEIERVKRENQESPVG